MNDSQNAQLLKGLSELRSFYTAQSDFTPFEPPRQHLTHQYLTPK